MVTTETAATETAATTTTSVTTETGEVAPIDADKDGYASDVDCDDTDSAIHPGAKEICDGIDNDCTGAADEEWDEDGDGTINSEEFVEMVKRCVGKVSVLVRVHCFVF